MRWKRRRVVYLCIFTIVLYAVFTGGLAICIQHDFNGQSNIHLADGLDSDVWLAPRLSNWHVPLICHYYGASGPYGLRLQIWDSSEKYSSIEITEIILEYSDGEVARNANKWTRNLERHTQHNSSSAGIIKTEMMMLSDTIDDLVTRHMDVTITVKGHLVKFNGAKVEILASQSFEAQTGFHIESYWPIMLGEGV